MIARSANGCRRFREQARGAGAAGYHVWTDQPGKQIDQGDMYPIVYGAPVSPLTVSALGFDQFSEPIRNAAMTRARYTASPSATRLWWTSRRPRP